MPNPKRTVKLKLNLNSLIYTMKTTFEYRYIYYNILLKNIRIPHIHGIYHEIIMFLVFPPMKLLSWVDEEKLIEKHAVVRLSENPNAFTLLEKHMDKLTKTYVKDYLSYNASAVHFLERNPDLIEWDNLNMNTGAVHILEKNLDKIDPFEISYNENAIDLLERHSRLIHLDTIVSNRKFHLLKDNLKKTIKDHVKRRKCYIESMYENPGAIELIESMVCEHNCESVRQHLSKNTAAIHILKKDKSLIDWSYLVMNPAAMDLIQNNLDKIPWKYLGYNENPAAIALIEKKLHELDEVDKYYIWEGLASNPYAIKLLEENQEKINYRSLAMNPAIFEKDENKIKQMYTFVAHHNKKKYSELVNPINQID